MHVKLILSFLENNSKSAIYTLTFPYNNLTPLSHGDPGSGSSRFDV